MISNSIIILIVAILAIVAIVAVVAWGCRVIINNSKERNSR